MNIRSSSREGFREPTRSERWNALDPVVRGRILEVLMALRKRAPRTVRNYSDALARLSEMGSLDNVDLMGKIVSAG